MDNKLRFVVMGDLHYVQPESHKETLGGRPRGVTEIADVTRNLWMTQNVTLEVISSIAALKPDFIIQTGDIIQGHCDDQESGLREMKEALQLLEGLGAPVFFALGTHDGVVGGKEEQQVLQYVYPAIGKALGTAPVTKGYYTFEKSGSLFIVLDYTTFRKDDEQVAYIRQVFEQSGKYEHVFLFAHPPLVCVGRPFFSHFDFVNTVLQEAANHPIDAYFCGHTHNQIATLHNVGGHWMPQLKSAVLGYPERAPVPLSDVRPILPDSSVCEYGWGYLEDSAPGWWEITVNGKDVQADWHVLRRGVVGQLHWRRGEKAVFTMKPEFSKTSLISLPALDNIRSVRLRAAGSNCKAPDGYQVSLHGKVMGTLPRLEYFDSRQFMEIDPEYWPVLSELNELTVTTAEEPMCIGGFVLEIETEKGCIRSTVSDYYASTDKWDYWGKAPVNKISPGESVSITLSFGAEG